MKKLIRALGYSSTIVASVFFSFVLEAQDVVEVHATRRAEDNVNRVRADQVIMKSEIEQSSKQYVHELLGEVAGLNVVQSGGAGGQVSLFLHGLKSEHVLVLVDGVPMNDPSTPGHSFDFSKLSLLNVERIEVVKAPDSVHYGSDALAGVVKVWTRTPRKNWNTHWRGEVGGHQSRTTLLEVSGPLTDNFGISSAGEWQKTKGVSAASSAYPGNREADGYSRKNAQAKIDGKFWGNGRVLLGGKWSENYSDLDKGGGANQDDHNDRMTERERSAFLKFEKTINDYWAPTLMMSHADHTRISNNEADYPGDMFAMFEYDHGSTNRISIQNTNNIGEHWRVTSGVDQVKDTMRINQVLATHSASATGALASLDYQKDQVGLLVGARYDHHQTFGDYKSFSFGPSYSFNNGGSWPMAFNFHWATGFKAPSLYQLYSQYGNSNLAPETVLSYQADLLLTSDHLDVTAKYFHAKVKQVIDYDFVRSKYFNLNMIESQGGEFELTGKFNSSWRGGVIYTLTKAHDQDGKAALRRPTNQLVGKVSYRSDRWSAHLHSHYIGTREDIHSTTYQRVKMPAYLLLGVSGNYFLKKNLALDARVDNILDKRYEEVHGMGTTGRVAYLGMNYDF